jgi:phosphohistidine phosphatase
MKHLTIIRHAKSSWDHPDLDDILRPLNERGKNALKIIGKYLLQKQIQPDLIISSPATRAIDTASGIGEIIWYDKKDISVEPVVYFGTSAAVISMLQGIENSIKDVFLFGHEPILSSLIFQLTKNHLEKFPTCSVCRISLKTDKWSSIKTGNIEFFITPKQVTVV